MFLSVFFDLQAKVNFVFVDLVENICSNFDFYLTNLLFLSDLLKLSCISAHFCS